MPFFSRCAVSLLFEELAAIRKHLHIIEQQGTTMADDLKTILSAENDERSELDQVLAAIDSLEAQIAAGQQNGLDPTQVQAILSQIASNKQAMVDKLTSIQNSPPPAP